MMTSENPLAFDLLKEKVFNYIQWCLESIWLLTGI